MKINHEIVTEAAEYVAEYLNKELPENFCYHDLNHTTSVVNAADFLCRSMGIAENEKNILLVAAWFHDTGFTKQSFEHETEGALIASQFLQSKKVDNQELDVVVQCILATKVPQQPKNKFEQILCDADLFYLGEKDMIERSDLLRREWATTLNKFYTDEEWYKLNVQFLMTHTFHTQYCRNHLNYRKLRNIKKFIVRLEQLAHSINTDTNNIAA
jgi:uncharacterized protein